jgi:glutamate formiminotransferase
MGSITVHREARKERSRLPKLVTGRFEAVEEAIVANPYAPAFKREAGWGGRTMLVAGVSVEGTTYRMAWEVISASAVVIWAYGPHEGFYGRLSRRAKQR